MDNIKYNLKENIMDRIIMDNITDNIKDNIKANIALINKNDTNNDIKEMNNESENNFKNNNSLEYSDCRGIEDMEHIYKCKHNWTKETNIKIHFEEIFRNDIKKQLEICKQFFRNLEKRENKLGLSCANLSKALARYPSAISE